MLTIDQATYDAIVAHAKRDHPDEACGIVAGPEGSDRPERLVEMVNAAGSPTFYEFDSTELLQLYKQMWANDEEPVSAGAALSAAATFAASDDEPEPKPEAEAETAAEDEPDEQPNDQPEPEEEPKPASSGEANQPKTDVDISETSSLFDL